MTCVLNCESIKSRENNFEYMIAVYIIYILTWKMLWQLRFII